MGFNQNSTFGFGRSGSAGPSGATNVQTPSFVIGDPGGPVVGQSTFIVTGAIGGSVDWINVGDQQYMTGSGYFTFNSGTGEIDISPNTWDSGVLGVQYRLPT